MKRPYVAVDCQELNIQSLHNFLEGKEWSKSVQILVLDNQVPPFVEAALEDLYANLFSSIKRLRIYGRLEGASTYLAKNEGKIEAVYLYRIDRNRVYVLNELIEINQREMRQFCETIFSKYNLVNVISFSAIQTNTQFLPYPFKKFNCSENPVLTLHESDKKYLEDIGGSTRRNMKYNMNKLKRDFPTFNFQFYEKERVTDFHIREIIRLKQARFAEKNKESGIGEGEIERILTEIKECDGLVGIATINGCISGGTISYRIQKNYFLAIISHNPEYNRYSLGIICCYLTICECISRGGREFHFLWGREDYKYRLLGLQRDLDNLHIFRSPIQLVLNFNIVIPSVCKARIRMLRLWLLDPKNRQSFISRTAIKLIGYSRDVKQILGGVRSSKSRKKTDSKDLKKQKITVE